MDSIRLTPPAPGSLHLPCCRCGKTGGQWDRIVTRAYCPACEEALILGEAEPLVERTQPAPCAVCERSGTVCLTTYPLHGKKVVQVDLCPDHLRGLLGRRLGPLAYQQLRRRLAALGVDVNDIFLLHDAFYDNLGHALRPAIEPI